MNEGEARWALTWGAARLSLRLSRWIEGLPGRFATYKSAVDGPLAKSRPARGHRRYTLR